MLDIWPKVQMTSPEEEAELLMPLNIIETHQPLGDRRVLETAQQDRQRRASIVLGEVLGKAIFLCRRQ
jgi:hypothetical protein